jgi:mono/diheme cytochrome c family protein
MAMLNTRHKAMLRATFLSAFAFLPGLPALAAEQAALELGKKVFTEVSEPQCGLCHTLKDAGSEGEIGPALDELELTAEKVETAVRGGVGVMPPFEETLSEDQIKAVSSYVATVAGKAQ